MIARPSFAGGRSPRVLWGALTALIAGAAACHAGGSAWRPAAPSPLARFEGPGVVVDGTLYVFGGFHDRALHASARVDAYDPATDRWRRRSDMPAAVTHLTPALDGTTVWFAGGYEGDNPGRTVASVWRYDVRADAWSEGPPLPEPRAGGALVRDGRRLHYFGGFAADRDSTPGDHWVLDLDTLAGWQPRAPLPEPRGHLSALAHAGRLWAIGGQRRHDTDPIDVATVHAYDPETDRWIACAPMPTPRSHFEGSTFVWKGEIVAAGGRNNVGGEDAMARMAAYDPRTDSWRELPPLPNALLGPVLRPMGRRLVLTTGSQDGYDRPLTSTWIADVEEILG